MGEVVEGEEATIEGVIEDLREKEYKIKEVNTGTNSVIGLNLSNNEIITNKNLTETLTYTINYGEGRLRYFVEVQGKDYEIIYDDETITINTEEIDLKEIDIKPIIVVESNNNDLVKAELSENNVITLNIGNKGGETVVTLKEKNSNISKICKIIVKVPAIGLTVEPNKQSIFVGDTIKLVAKPTPEDTTDKIAWSSSDESIATVTEDGTVIGKAKGTATISATCGSQMEKCEIIVSYFASAVTGSDYGKIVTNYKSGQDWQIFYADEENVYLISKNNVNDPIYNSNDWKTGRDSNNYTSGTTMLNNSTRFPAVKKWLSKYISYIDSNSISGYASLGVQGMLFLLDSGNVWNGTYKNNYADYAIGGPTAEMLVASLNEGKTSDLFRCSIPTQRGYVINESTTGVDLKFDSNDFRYGKYYLSSSAHTELYSGPDKVLWEVSGSGTMRSIEYASSGRNSGYRPIVCLKSSIKLIPNTYNSDGTVLTYKIAQ